MKKIVVVLAVVAVSAMAVSCGPEAKGKKWGKKVAKLDNKMQKFQKSLTLAEQEEFDKALEEAYDKKKTESGAEMAGQLKALLVMGDYK